MRIGCIYPGTFIHFIRIPSQKDPFISLYEPLSNPSTKQISMLTAHCRLLVIYNIWSSDEWMVQGFLHFFGRDGMPCHPRYCWYLSIFGWNLLDDCCFFHVFSLSWTILDWHQSDLDCFGQCWIWPAGLWAFLGLNIYIYSTYLNPFNHHHIYHWLNMAGISHIIIPDIIRGFHIYHHFPVFSL